jgi:hypothetical protein
VSGAPRIQSTPRDVHPLFIGFIRAARELQGAAAGTGRWPPARRKPSHEALRIRGRPRQTFFLIAGPGVIESMQLQLDTAGTLKEITPELGIPFIFKSSFDKANRTSVSVFRGRAWKRR